MPSLAVGTTNPGKVAAVESVLTAHPALRSLKIVPVKVDSGVSDQPKTLEETTRGARNRAQAAARAEGADALGIGLESGLFESDGRMFDVCACVIFDGAHSHVGYSCAWELPPAVTEKVREGLDLTQAFNACKICDDPKIGDKGGVLGVLTGGRVSRPQYTAQSIQMAILSLNTEHYECSDTVPRGVNDPLRTGPSLDGVMAGVGLLVLGVGLWASWRGGSLRRRG